MLYKCANEMRAVKRMRDGPSVTSIDLAMSNGSLSESQIVGDKREGGEDGGAQEKEGSDRDGEEGEEGVTDEAARGKLALDHNAPHGRNRFDLQKGKFSEFLTRNFPESEKAPTIAGYHNIENVISNIAETALWSVEKRGSLLSLSF